MKKHNPRCPACKSQRTIKRGSERKRKRYFCKKCHKSFSIYYGPKQQILWIPHIDGVPFRKLGDEYKLSPAQAYAKTIRELKTVPDNTLLTQQYCDPAKFSGILVLDGKFVKVAEHGQKIPFIYAIDYLTHDIPVGLLATGESHVAFVQLFRMLRQCNYPLKVVVCDDRMTVRSALSKAYPKAKIQLCQNHFLENLRRVLHVRTENTYHRFFTSLRDRVFLKAKDEQAISQALQYVLKRYGQQDTLVRDIIFEIYERSEILFQYLTIPGCPRDTNLVELYNSHLQGRLKSIKGFESFAGAQRWLNAWMIRRRTKTLTDCDEKFKRLNGYPSLFWTIKDGMEWPTILGVKPPQKHLERTTEPTILIPQNSALPVRMN